MQSIVQAEVHRICDENDYFDQASTEENNDLKNIDQIDIDEDHDCYFDDDKIHLILTEEDVDD